jgi:hypothetical protein
MRKILIIFASTILFIYSCSKEETKAFDIYGKYQSSNVIIVEKPVLYTINGQTEDIGIIKSFLQRHKSGYFDLDVTNEPTNSMSILNILREGKATVSYDTSLIHLNIFSITDKEIILAKPDSASQLYDIGIPERCETLSTLLRKPKLNQRCYKISDANGFVNLCFSEPFYPFLIDNNQLYALAGLSSIWK